MIYLNAYSVKKLSEILKDPVIKDQFDKVKDSKNLDKLAQIIISEFELEIEDIEKVKYLLRLASILK